MNSNMVCGFLFIGAEVLLVSKKSPTWQNGLLNGVGGKVENNETFLDAMHREWKEETGLMNPEWTAFASEEVKDEYFVMFFAARLVGVSSIIPPAMLSMPRENDVGERLLWTSTMAASRMSNVVGNLKWLLPLAMDPRGVLMTTRVYPREQIGERPTW